MYNYPTPILPFTGIASEQTTLEMGSLRLSYMYTDYCRCIHTYIDRYRCRCRYRYVYLHMCIITLPSFFLSQALCRDQRRGWGRRGHRTRAQRRVPLPLGPLFPLGYAYIYDRVNPIERALKVPCAPK